VVRLSQGRADAETVYATDPGAPARDFVAAGAEWVHVVDLDGAFTGEQANAAAVEAVLASGLKVELGGGIRSLEVVRRWLKLGVQRVVIGTKAVTDPNFLHECLNTFSPEAIAVGIDAIGGKVAVKGWLEKVDLTAVEFAWSVQEIGVHDIRRFREIEADHPNLVGVITGKAIYDGTLDLAEALRVTRE